MKKFFIILVALVVAGLSVAVFSNKVENVLDNELLEANVEALTYAVPSCTGPKVTECFMVICKCMNTSACADKHGCDND